MQIRQLAGILNRWEDLSVETGGRLEYAGVEMRRLIETENY